ncbi:MAG: tRNA threonylcarbamoyladenosine dehydratase [Planctomycetaceae bacterium]|nr:tRNA threonylcarbamoyladenosine dehydratase [Planctomycetaceae bacterium]
MQFQRTGQLLGQEALSQIRRSFVVVVGLGAVGGQAAEALARAGVGRLRLVDHDTVRESNLNRQIFATWDMLGQKKTEVAEKRIHSISPGCHVETLDTFVHRDTLDQVLADKPDVVIDAIDSLNPKVELIAELIHREQSAISSMGAALRLDPAKIRVGDLAEITHCPLAAFIRKRLRHRQVEPHIPCVYSCEETRLLHRDAVFPPDETEIHLQEKGRRRSSLGSLPTITGIFGLTAAHWVLMRLSG